jgi:phosphoglycolate phosphatase-like HAD superfamily hydrolase
VTARRLLLFDVDGTLVDVDGAGRSALRRALEEVYGTTGPIEDFPFRGKTDPSIVRGLLEAAGAGTEVIEARMPGLWSVYLDALEEELARRRRTTRTHPGVRELVARLEADQRFTLALVTGNVQGGAWRKLAACDLRSPFRFGAFGSDSEHREELPPVAIRRARDRLGLRFEPRDVWVIGDTPEDVRCGRHSGLRTLAVATGGYSVEELEAHGPERVVASLEEVDLLVRDLAA